MNCKKCGSVLSENDQFCKNCGETVNSQMNNVYVQPSTESQNNGGFQQQPIGIGQPVNNQQPVGIGQPVNNQQPVGIGQPMNNQQPMYNNMNNNQQGWKNYKNEPMNKSNGNGKFIVIGLAIVICIFAVLFVIGMLTDKDNTGSLTGGGSSGITQTSNKNYKVNFKGFTFEIPDNLVYEESDGNLLIGDEEGTWVTVLQLEQGSFSQLQANKNQLQTVVQKRGYIASAVSEKTLGGVNFITLELTKSGQKAITAFTKANSIYLIGITAMNQDNEYDYKLLEKIAPTIKSAQYNGNATNNIVGNNKIDMNVIANLAK